MRGLYLTEGHPQVYTDEHWKIAAVDQLIGETATQYLELSVPGTYGRLVCFYGQSGIPAAEAGKIPRPSLVLAMRDIHPVELAAEDLVRLSALLLVEEKVGLTSGAYIRRLTA